MVTEPAKPEKNHESNRNPGREIRGAEKEFESLVLKNIPGWTAAWNMLLQHGKELSMYVAPGVVMPLSQVAGKIIRSCHSCSGKPFFTDALRMTFLKKDFSEKKGHGREEPVDLQKRIRRKILELVDKEEALVHLYETAAELAKKKEEEFNGKTAVLIQQIEKDKNLMKMLVN